MYCLLVNTVEPACKNTNQWDWELAQRMHEAVTWFLKEANGYYGPNGVPAPLEGATVHWASNCLGFDDPDRKTKSKHLGTFPPIIAHMMSENYKEWRLEEFKQFHHMLLECKESGETAVHASLCLGGKHRSQGWKWILKVAAEENGALVVESYGTASPLVTSISS